LKILNCTFVVVISVLVTSCLFGSKGSKSTLKFNNTPISNTSVSGNDKQKSIEAFKTTVYPLITTMSCVQCHGDSKKYQPYYAVSDVSLAWQSILIDAKKVNLENPETSRIYLRLKIDRHNCLTDSADQECDSEAASLLTAIKRWKDMVKLSSGSAIKTDPFYFKDTSLSNPDAEFGTFLIEAEQDNFPEAMGGRFVTELDSRASGFKYAMTGMPAANPTTNAARTPIINKGSACEVTTPAMITNTVNGPYQISEEGTHINSGASNGSIVIKDGQRPFSIAVRSLLIRPDKRMEYAKMLTGWSAGSATGVAQFGPFQQIALTPGNFDVGNIDVSSVGRTIKTAIDVTKFPLDGNLNNDVSFKTLPYFISRDSVFLDAPDTRFLDFPNNTINNLTGGTLPLKNLFKLPQNDFTSRDILNYFEKNDQSNANKMRKDLVFKFLKEKIDSYTLSGARYNAIQSMDLSHFYSLYGNLKLNIKACPNNVCTTTSQEVEVTSGTDTDGVLLTYDNALDILKVNAAGTGFVAGSMAELQAGVAFRRMDVYLHHNVAVDAKTYGDTFDQIFYNYAGNVFSEKSRINYPLNRATVNLNLKAFYTNGASSLSKSDSLANFQTTLHPVLQQSRCISCHDGSQAARVAFASSNPIVGYNEIERIKLVNFTTPLNSFRRAVFPTDPSIVHNCGNNTECDKAQSDFVAAIKSWNTANEAVKIQNSALPFHELTDKERTPGMLEYKFTIKKNGLYNIWTKVKSTNNFAINLRVLDGANPLKVSTSIVNPVQTANSCISYVFPEYTDWGWFTPGRANDLTKLESTGKLKKDSNGKLLTLEDNRTYWKLEAGKTYTLQIFEATPQTKIDLIAIDYVANMSDLLDFQPDLLSRDENNIADYQKRVLSYDISKLVGMAPESAYFKVEVKTALEGQNYIFRNPRIVSPKANIHVKGIKVFINGATAFNDASWDNIDLIAGDNQIFTFASLLALIPRSPTTDFFQFGFEKIEKSTKVISELDPRGTAPVLLEGRKCRELDLFMNTVKPILRSATLMLKEKDGINEYVDSFPGDGRKKVDRAQTYQCMTCHNDTHPYFKMTTFDYPEILCAQALSRVDFAFYRESLLVRGLDGTGVHPKLHFIEELQYSADMQNVIPYNANDGTRILSGMIKNQATPASPSYFSKWISGFYFGTYSQANLGLSPNWASNSADKQNLARAYMGQFRRIDYNTIPDLSAELYYEPLVHDQLIGDIRTENDNLVTGTFVNNGPNMYRTYIPTTADTAVSMNARPIDLNVAKSNDKITIVNGKKVFSPALSDEDMNNKLEDLKGKYRNVILNWIAKEHEHIKNGD
jgi:hypothetical protein